MGKQFKTEVEQRGKAEQKKKSKERATALIESRKSATEARNAGVDEKKRKVSETRRNIKFMKIIRDFWPNQ